MLISRSSLSLVKINRVEILTVLQGINFVLWILQAKYKFINIYVQFVLMVYVGLLGGASYVNTFYVLLNSTTIRNKDKEFIVNLVALCINFGIVAASAFVLMMDNTFLKDS